MLFKKNLAAGNYFAMIILMLISKAAFAQDTTIAFIWPEAKQAAISLSFDDARMSQAEAGTELLDQYGIKATFYVVPSNVQERLDGWKKAVAAGHEIGNHSLTHPCTGNFSWSRKNALEIYNLDDMRLELAEANKQIEELLGVKPEVFAYPCGQKFVGRGTDTKSYIPLVADLFISGRGWLDETSNDPGFCDLAQLMGVEMDGKTFDEILPLIEAAKKTGHWIVFGGHEMAASGYQTTRLSMLKELIEYAQNPANGVWIAPVGTVAKYIEEQRKKE